jgi:hypothetical protein
MSNPQQLSTTDYYARADSDFGPFGLRQGAQLYDDPPSELFSRLRALSFKQGSTYSSEAQALALIGVLPVQGGSGFVSVGGLYKFGYSVYITVEKT